MKITFIRHSKVLFNWRPFYNSDSFDLACSEYDSSLIEAHKKMELTEATLYISNLRRSEDTACFLFDKREMIKIDLLNEIPLKSFVNTNFKLPTIIWMLLGRVQWYFNHSRQTESQKKSKERINLFLDKIEQRQHDCIIVGHGFYFAQMITEMKKRKISGNMKKRIKNEELREFVYQPL